VRGIAAHFCRILRPTYYNEKKAILQVAAVFTQRTVIRLFPLKLRGILPDKTQLYTVKTLVFAILQRFDFSGILIKHTSIMLST
jgi:hypothetical protein